MVNPRGNLVAADVGDVPAQNVEVVAVVEMIHSWRFYAMRFLTVAILAMISVRREHFAGTWRRSKPGNRWKNQELMVRRVRRSNPLAPTSFYSFRINIFWISRFAPRVRYVYSTICPHVSACSFMLVWFAEYVVPFTLANLPRLDREGRPTCPPYPAYRAQSSLPLSVVRIGEACTGRNGNQPMKFLGWFAGSCRRCGAGLDQTETHRVLQKSEATPEHPHRQRKRNYLAEWRFRRSSFVTLKAGIPSCFLHSTALEKAPFFVPDISCSKS